MQMFDAATKDLRLKKPCIEPKAPAIILHGKTPKFCPRNHEGG